MPPLLFARNISNTYKKHRDTSRWLNEWPGGHGPGVDIYAAVEKLGTDACRIKTTIKDAYEPPHSHNYNRVLTSVR